MRRYERLDPKQLGRYMRHYRMQAGIGAKAAGAAIGKSAASLYQIESGKNRLSTTDMVILLALYGVDVDEAFCEPWEIIDNPSRVKAAKSVRSVELQGLFSQLPDREQTVVLQVARMALRSVGSDSEDSEN